jgi:hypothetical protein
MSRRGRGGDRKSGKKYPGNLLKYNPLCLWCGLPFVAARPEAKTCNTAHRVALARYVAKHGQPPMFPFGVKPDLKPERKKTAS